MMDLTIVPNFKSVWHSGLCKKSYRKASIDTKKTSGAYRCSLPLGLSLFEVPRNKLPDRPNRTSKQVTISRVSTIEFIPDMIR